MTSFGWALIGAIGFVLAYTYYTVASLYYLPGGDAITWLIEFTAPAVMVLLAGAVAGACLVQPPGKPEGQED